MTALIGEVAWQELRQAANRGVVRAAAICGKPDLSAQARAVSGRLSEPSAGPPIEGGSPDLKILMKENFANRQISISLFWLYYCGSKLDPWRRGAKLSHRLT